MSLDEGNRLKKLHISAKAATTSTSSSKARKRHKKRHPIKNQLLYCHPFFIMTSFIISMSALLVIVLLMNQSHFTSGSADYLYNNAQENVGPIIDYIKPDKEASESDVDYDNRILHPKFLTDRYDKPRLVEFYAPWCGHCVHYKPQYIEMGKESKAINPIIDFYAVSCVAHKNLCQLHEVHGYPTLKFFAENSDVGHEVKKFGLNAKSLHEDYFVKYSQLGKTDSEDNGQDDTKQKDIGKQIRMKLKGQKVMKENQNDIYVDAASSLSFALQSSIFMTNNALSSKQKEVFQQWLELLSKTIPRESNTMNESLHQVNILLSNMNFVVKSEENLMEILKQTKYNTQWTESCKAGYTCGLWQLLHIITIGLVHHNDSLDSKSSSESNRNTALSTMDTADTIRNYIEYYFTCDECRKNFVQMYEQCQFNRCNRLSYNVGSKIEWKQLALWLWETHNDVNVRLLHESKGEMDQVTSSDEQLVRWPSQLDCPYCWQGGGGWNEDVVYDYLDSYYWPKKVQIFKQANIINEDDVQSYSYIITIGSVIVLFVIVQLRKRQKVKKCRKK